MENTLKYRRILLKLSGESLRSPKGFGIDPLRAEDIALRVKDVHDLGVDVAIFIGAGNLWRGRIGLDHNSIEAVAEGVVDGAAVDSLIYDYLLARHPALASRTRVIQTSPAMGAQPSESRGRCPRPRSGRSAISS